MDQQWFAPLGENAVLSDVKSDMDSYQRVDATAQSMAQSLVVLSKMEQNALSLAKEDYQRSRAILLSWIKSSKDNLDAKAVELFL